MKTVNVTGGTVLYGAFYNCANLTSITLPDAIKAINNYVFYGCSKLSSLPTASITSIGAYSFYGCSTVNSIDLSTVNSISDYAFANCTKITSVAITSLTTSIGAKVFSGCSSLTSISVDANNPNYSSRDGILYNKAKTSIISVPMAIAGTIVIPSTIKSIDDETFLGCSKITSITIPEGVTSIGNRAFSGCYKLTEVVVPDTVTNIGSGAFASCSGLTSITLPFIGDSLNGSKTYFGYIFGATYSSNNSSSVPSALKTVVISKGTIVANNSFYSCKYITSISLPDSITSIEYNAFNTCNALTTINIPNSVTSIGSYAFQNCTSLTSITIPNNVTEIGDYAFSGCSKLDSITLGEKVASIGTYCFQNCTALTYMTIPAKVTTIKDYAFAGCTKLSSIYVNTSNTAYSSQNGILYNKTKTAIVHVPLAITGSITIPNTVTSIGNGTFGGCNKITSVTLTSNITSMGTGVFNGCNALTSLTLPFLGASKSDTTHASLGYSFSSSVYIPTTLKTVVILGGTTIGKDAFAYQYCANISSITLPSTITSIGEGAFSGSGITTITIPARVSSIGEGAFDCANLTTINVASGNSYYVSQNGVLYNKSKTKLLAVPKAMSGSVVIPNSVTEISGRALSGCTNITSITIGSGISIIWYYEFSGCTNLESVTIGKNVKTLYASAFDGCSKLNSVTFADTSGWKENTGTGYLSMDFTDPKVNAGTMKRNQSANYYK